MKMETVKQTVTVSGMSCNGCANHVQRAFETIPAVQSVDVSLDEKKASVVTNQAVTLKEFQDALAGTNYSVVTIL